MNTYRDFIVELLGLIASKDKQRAYGQSVPNVVVTQELICQWFDDTYLPNTADFKECFSAAELAILAEFDQYFEARRAGLPDDLDELHQSAVWDEICQEAQRTLTRLLQKK